MHHRPATLFLALVTLVLSAAPLAAAGPPRVPVGTVEQTPEGAVEAFEPGAEIVAELTGSAVGERLEVAAFPAAPGERAAVTLERVDLYAPGARIRIVAGGEEHIGERSPRLQFLGRGQDGLRVGLTTDPAGGGWRGVVISPAGLFEIAEPAGDGRHRLRSPAIPHGGMECGSDALPTPDDVSFAATVADRLPRLRGGAGGPIFSAVIAVDTDNELHWEKFGNDTTDATDYIADLFVTMNVMYERDLSLRLLQGETFLRLDTDSPPTFDDDPYDNTDTPASNAALVEFGSHWAANMGAVERVFAMLLSGKSSASNVASGIAWLDGYCENQSTGGGYSVNQVFTGNFPVSNDARLVGHELGHNHGSPHTHCYNPPIDECSNIGAGCYDGSNGFNCPGGPGTLMSYCNFSASNCGANLLEFHPTVIALIDGFIAVHTPNCIEPLQDPDAIFGDTFESGNTTAWGSTSP